MGKPSIPDPEGLVAELRGRERLIREWDAMRSRLSDPQIGNFASAFSYALNCQDRAANAIEAQAAENARLRGELDDRFTVPEIEEDDGIITVRAFTADNSRCVSFTIYPTRVVKVDTAANPVTESLARLSAPVGGVEALIERFARDLCDTFDHEPDDKICDQGTFGSDEPSWKIAALSLRSFLAALSRTQGGEVEPVADHGTMTRLMGASDELTRLRGALEEIAGPGNADLDYRQLYNGCQDIARTALNGGA